MLSFPSLFYSRNILNRLLSPLLNLNYLGSTSGNFSNLMKKVLMTLILHDVDRLPHSIFLPVLFRARFFVGVFVRCTSLSGQHWSLFSYFIILQMFYKSRRKVDGIVRLLYFSKSPCWWKIWKSNFYQIFDITNGLHPLVLSAYHWCDRQIKRY